MKTPRVTEVLKAFSGYDYVAKDVLARAALRGTTVHQVCAGLAKGNWIEKALINEEYHGYIASFKAWSTMQIKEYLVIEKRFNIEDDNNCFTGQLDFVAKGNDGKTYLVDIKTSASKQKTYPLQMAAYWHLLNYHGIKVEAALIVYLSKTGEFPDIECYENLDEQLDIFLSALKCWHYFNKGKKDNDTNVTYRSKRRKKTPKHTPKN